VLGLGADSSTLFGVAAVLEVGQRLVMIESPSPRRAIDLRQVMESKRLMLLV